MYCGVTRWIDQCSRVWDQWEGAWDLIWTQQTAIMQPGSVSNYTFPNTQSHTTLERPRRNFQTMIQNKFNLVAENVDDPKLGGWLAGLLAAQYSSLSLHVDTEIFCSNLDPDTTTPHPTLKYNNKGIWQNIGKTLKIWKEEEHFEFCTTFKTEDRTSNSILSDLLENIWRDFNATITDRQAEQNIKGETQHLKAYLGRRLSLCRPD